MLARMLLTLLFAAFVLFLYGPVVTIIILAFGGPDSGLTFPMRGLSLHWFAELLATQSVGDLGAALQRTAMLAAHGGRNHGDGLARRRARLPHAGSAAAPPCSLSRSPA